MGPGLALGARGWGPPQAVILLKAAGVFVRDVEAPSGNLGLCADELGFGAWEWTPGGLLLGAGAGRSPLLWMI